MNKSVVLLSGGQDSTTAFYKAMKETQVVAAIFFNYGQQHAIAEHDCAVETCDNEGVNLVNIPLGETLKITSESALHKHRGDVNKPHPLLEHLPASFVPGRNLVFMVLASAYAMKVGATDVWAGMCQEDYSGYPDCRHRTLMSLVDACKLGMEFDDLKFIFPIMNLDKADTFKLAYDLGVLNWIINHTHTGYTGRRNSQYEWGWGPDIEQELDPASKIRKAGWEEFKKRYPQCLI